MADDTLARMRLVLLGTGAADYDWSRLGEPGVRGSTSSLLNGHILIDCGATGLRNLQRNGIDFGAVDTLLVTHSHGDQFQPDQIVELARTPGRAKPFRIYAAPEALAQLPSLRNLLLGDTDTSELKFLADMPSLTELDLRDNPLLDLSPLLDCPWLDRLKLSQRHKALADTQLAAADLAVEDG